MDDNGTTRLKCIPFRRASTSSINCYQWRYQWRLSMALSMAPAINGAYKWRRRHCCVSSCWPVCVPYVCCDFRRRGNGFSSPPPFRQVSTGQGPREPKIPGVTRARVISASSTCALIHYRLHGIPPARAVVPDSPGNQGLCGAVRSGTRRAGPGGGLLPAAFPFCSDAASLQQLTPSWPPPRSLWQSLAQ